MKVKRYNPGGVLNTGGAGSAGGSFKDAMKEGLAGYAKTLGGPLGGIAGAISARKQMKAQGVNPTLKGMAKGYAGGMLGGPLLGNLGASLAENSINKAGQREKMSGTLKHGGRVPRGKRSKYRR